MTYKAPYACSNRASEQQLSAHKVFSETHHPFCEQHCADSLQESLRANINTKFGSHIHSLALLPLNLILYGSQTCCGVSQPLPCAVSPIYCSSALLRRCQAPMQFNTSSSMYEAGPLSLWLSTQPMFAAAPAAGWATWQQLMVTARNPWCVGVHKQVWQDSCAVLWEHGCDMHTSG